jgi:hypothetical protein
MGQFLRLCAIALRVVARFGQAHHIERTMQTLGRELTADSGRDAFDVDDATHVTCPAQPGDGQQAINLAAVIRNDLRDRSRRFARFRPLESAINRVPYQLDQSLIVPPRPSA